MNQTLIMAVSLVAMMTIGCDKKDATNDSPAPVVKLSDKAPSTSAETPLATSGVTEADEKLMAEMVAMMETVADTIDTNKADCAKMVTELSTLADSNQALMERIVASKDNEAMEATFTTKYMPKLEGIGKKMASVAACQEHEGLTEAMSKLGFNR